MPRSPVLLGFALLLALASTGCGSKQPRSAEPAPVAEADAGGTTVDDEAAREAMPSDGPGCDPRRRRRGDGPMPETVTLELVIPPELGDPDAFRQAVRERVAAVEREAADERRRTGRCVLGRRAILRQAFNARPSSREPRRGLRPRIAALNRRSTEPASPTRSREV